MVITADGTAPYQLLTTGNVDAGDATMYIGPVGTAMPADTVNMGISWSVGIAAWVPQGLTDGGITFGYNPTTSDLTVEESPIPAGIVVPTADFPVTVAFAEDTINSALYSFGSGAITTQAAGASAVAKSTLTMAYSLNSYALGLEYKNPTGHWTRISIPSVVSVGSPSVASTRSKNRIFAATFRATCLLTAIQVVYKTGESTS